MCGIVGFGGRSASAGDAFTAQCGTMRHRGPDASGEWRSADSRVALGHRRLSIIDLSEAGSQPMSDSTGHLHITFNGAIYNYREIRQKLEDRGRRFRSASDIEVLLQPYREWASDRLRRLTEMCGF